MFDDTANTHLEAVGFSYLTTVTLHVLTSSNFRAICRKWAGSSSWSPLPRFHVEG